MANLTRRDGEELLELVRRVTVRTAVEVFPPAAAEDALDRLRSDEIRGAALLDVRT